MKNVTITQKLILSVLAMTTVALIGSKTALAECETNYGGNKTCVFTGNFEIEKWVKLEGDTSWKDEVVVDLNDDDENDKEILFKVKVSAHLTDAEGVDPDDVDFDDLKMKDSLPDELKFLDSSDNDLTEEWDNMKPGESKTFYFKAKIKGDEKDRDGDFEKCVVNKAKLYYKDDLQGSDDAVVCYKKSDDVLGISTELPETGGGLLGVLSGISSLALGLYLKSKKA